MTLSPQEILEQSAKELFPNSYFGSVKYNHIALEKTAIHALSKQQEEIERLGEAQRWIPVSEKLPPVQKQITVWHKTGGIIHIYYSLMHRDLTLDQWRSRGITHWKNEPTPPNQ